MVITAEGEGVTGEATVQVQCVAPAAPVPVYPAEGEQVRQGDLTFSWKVSTGADTYEIQVARDASFSEVLYEARDITTAFINVPAKELGNQLQPGATYYWRVRAVSECGESEWSQVVSFSVPAVEPEIHITAPEAGATLTVGETVEILGPTREM